MTALRGLADVAAALLSLGVVGWGGWWTLLSAAALPAPRPGYRRARGRWHIVAIVPAHNEEAGVGGCVDSLRRAADAFDGWAEVVVVADNCTDATAAVASAHGAIAIERHDLTRRGKGFALEFAVDYLQRREDAPDAVLVIDADTAVSADIFDLLAACYEDGAQAVQVHNAVGAGVSEIVRLRRLQFMLTQWARPLGMRRLGLGTWLKGNGMSLSWALARDVLRGDSIAEDAAMTLTLARRGTHVVFEPRAEVRSVMPDDYATARSQDERWEHGRMRLVAPAMAATWHALRRRKFAAAAAAAEVGAPPLTLLGLAGGLCALYGAVRGGPLRPLHIAAGVSVVSYVALGLTAARAPLDDVAAIRFAPRFVAYKLRVYAAFATRRGATSWQRTARAEQHQVPAVRGQAPASAPARAAEAPAHGAPLDSGPAPEATADAAASRP